MMLRDQVVLGASYGVLGLEPRLAICKAEALPAVQKLWPVFQSSS